MKKDLGRRETESMWISCENPCDLMFPCLLLLLLMWNNKFWVDLYFPGDLQITNSVMDSKVKETFSRNSLTLSTFICKSYLQHNVWGMEINSLSYLIFLLNIVIKATFKKKNRDIWTRLIKKLYPVCLTYATKQEKDKSLCGALSAEVFICLDQ